MNSRLIGHHHVRHQSVLHRAPAGWKLAAGLIMIAGTVLAEPEAVMWFAAMALVLGAGIVISRLPLLFLFKRLLFLSPFVLGVVLANAWQPAGRLHWQTLAIKSGICLVTVILISNTTPFSKIVRVLQRIRVPDLLVTTIALMHRYLFVLAEESERMRKARLSRTFRKQGRFQWHTLSTVVGQLFVRASERAERIYAAMCARGWR